MEHDQSILALSIVVLTCIIVLPVAVKGVLGSLTLFEPITVLTVGFLLYFVLGPLIGLVTDDTAFLGRDFRPEYVRAFWGVAASSALMWIGYALHVGRRVGTWAARKMSSVSTGIESDHKRLYMVHCGWTLMVGGALGILLSQAISRGNVSAVLLPGVLSARDPTLTPTADPSLNYLFLMMEWFIPGYLLLTAAGAIRRRWVAMVLALSILVVYVSIGFRFRIVIFLVAAATVRYAGRPLRRTIPALLVGAVAVLALIGYVGASRSFYRTGGTYGSPTPDSAAVVEGTRGDSRIFDFYAAVLDSVPERIGFAGIEPLVAVLVLPIPRGVWAEKPYPEYLGKVGQSVGTPAAPYAGAAVPNFGEYYIAAGWLGVAVGMSLFGIGARALWAYRKATLRDPLALVVFACSLPFLMQTVTRGYTAQIVQEWFFIVFPAVLVSVHWNRRLKRGSTIAERKLSPTRGGFPVRCV